MTNGMNPFQALPQMGAVPDIQARQRMAQAMVAQQIQQLGSAIYARAAGERLKHPGPHQTSHDWHELARRSQAAAEAYFVATGIIEEQTPE